MSHERASDSVKQELEFHEPDQGSWLPVPGQPGQSENILAGVRQSHNHSRLLRFEPGTVTGQTLTHNFWEEVYILSGSLHDLRLDQTFTPGMYACRPPGMPHGPWSTHDGCITFEVRYSSPVEAVRRDLDIDTQLAFRYGKWLTSESVRDSTRLLELLEPHAVVVAVDGSAMTPLEYAQRVAGQSLSLELTQLTVQVKDNFALARGIMVEDLSKRGIRFTDGWVQFEGRWTCAISHRTYIEEYHLWEDGHLAP